MADRKLPTSLSTPPVAGPGYMDAVSSKVGMLFNSMALKPTAIVNAGNDYTITVDPVLDADVVAGMSFYIRPSANNTGPCRLRVTNANPWYNLVKASGEALAAGDFAAGTTYFVVFMGGEFTILSVANSEASDGAHTYYQEFLVSGTWAKPPGLSSDAIIIVEAWGGGGGGSLNVQAGGGGGGAYNSQRFRASELTASVSVTVGAGGAVGAIGGSSSFGSYLTTYGGGAGGNGASSSGGGGGGGVSSAGSSGTTAGVAGNGGGPAYPSGLISVGGPGTNAYGASGGSATSQNGGHAIYGGGGGCGNNGTVLLAGGMSIYGGGGGGNPGGISLFGGNGGNVGAAGSVPGGGGGRGAVGGAGKIIVRVVG